MTKKTFKNIGTEITEICDGCQEVFSRAEMTYALSLCASGGGRFEKKQYCTKCQDKLARKERQHVKN